MGLFDTPFRGLAQTLIGVLGATATLETTTEGDFDPLVNEDVAPTVATTSISISPPEQFNLQHVNRMPLGSEFISTLRGMVESGDTWILVAAADVTIGSDEKESYRVKISGDWFRVVNHSRIYSGDLVAAYFLHLRR